MKPAAKILKKVRRGVRTVAYANPIYQKILASGEQTGRLHFTLPDPWPGDVEAGLALMSTQGSLFDRPQPLRHASTLRNLRAVGTNAARQAALHLIDAWMARHDQWDDAEWSPSVLGERIAGWIGFYEFYAPAADAGFIAKLTISLQRQYKHLLRTLPPTLTGATGLRAIKGLIYGGLNFAESEKALGLAYDLLKRQVAAEILPDGGHVSRNPSTQLHILRHLIDLRAAFKAADIDMPDNLRPAIHVMVPALKLFRHGDGGLALFHGSNEETPLLIDAVMTQAEGRSRVLRRLPQTGYERLTAGRSLLIADGAKPPARNHGPDAHAGLLAFEFSHGRERLIVNCGARENAPHEWRMACAATAAHSTVTVEDTNACEVLPAGGVACPARVVAQRYEQNGEPWLDMSHNGYEAGFGLIHRRFLSLAADGEALRGHETLTGTAGRDYAVRWHLHPLIQASLAHSGRAALLRTASGGGWRLRIESDDPGITLALEQSVYCGFGGPRRSLQLKAGGCTHAAETALVWTLTREKKG